MAYTVDKFYRKVLEECDKMGSDFFPIPYIMNRLETAVHDFIGETVKFVENTQEIRDDIRTLYKPYKLPVVASEAGYLVSLPDDYQHLMSAMVVDDTTTVRQTAIIRHGQEDIYQADPDTRATAEYPSIFLYQDYIKVLSTGNPTFVYGMYIKQPTFGAYSEHDDIETEIAVDLPEHAVDKVIKIMVRDMFTATGDPRVQPQYAMKEDYRKRSK
jgi:hypothetical protein